MNKAQLLAAETFSYSYANYADHLGINPRFDKYMPDDIKTIEKIVNSNGGANEIAAKLEVEKDIAEHLLSSYLVAKKIVDADNAADSFRLAVKTSILTAIEEGLNSAESIDRLVGQICYRAADLAYLLDMEKKKLSDYSENLREWFRRGEGQALQFTFQVNVESIMWNVRPDPNAIKKGQLRKTRGEIKSVTEQFHALAA